MSIAEAEVMHVNWEELLRRYAKDAGQSLGAVGRWLSHRPSLRVACELIGATAEQAESLGKWMDKHGYPVPPLESRHDYHSMDVDSDHIERPGLRKTITVLDNINRKFTPEEITMFERLWRKGRTLDAIAETLNRRYSEVLCLLGHQWEEEQLEYRRAGMGI